MEIVNDCIRTNKAELKALLAFASTDPERTNLCGIGVRSDGKTVRVFGTDGHTALVWTGETYMPSRTAVLCRSDVERVEKAAKPRHTIWIRFDPTGATAQVEDGSDDKFELPIGIRADGLPPPIEQVMPAYNGHTVSAAVVSAAPIYLARLDIAAKAIAPRSPVTLQNGGDEMAPISVRFSDPAWQAAIMPCRP